jgi:hypothetical protein
MKMHPTNTVLMAIVSLVALATPAIGGPLAPKKPSDLVTLTSSGAACTNYGSAARRLDRRINPDGTVTPFSIPAKQVLVLTGASTFLEDAGVSDTAYTQIVYDIPPTQFGQGAIFAAGATDSGGGGTLVSSYSPNMVVKSGVRICCDHSGLTFFGCNAYGYLTKDK